MAVYVDPSRWYWVLGIVGLSALFGLLAGHDPKLAIVAALGLGFLLLTIADLTVGLAIFTGVSFLELISVASGVGLAKVFGLALAISWLATVASRPRADQFVWSSSPLLSWLTVGFLAWSALSLTWAENTQVGLGQLQRYMLVALLIPIVFTAVRSARDVKTVAGAFVVGATTAAAYGLFISPSASGADGAINATEQLNRIAGTVGDPNVLASVLLIGAILGAALAFAQHRSPAIRIALVGASALCFAVVVLTFSRGGLVGLGAALLLAPLVARRRGATLAAVLLVTTCVIAYIGALAPSDARERLVKNDGGSGRTDIWRIAWRMVEVQPLTGVGAGNFQTASIHYQIQPGAATVRTDLVDNPSVAHNSYLEVLAELGIVGLAFFLGIIITALSAVLKATKRFLRDQRQDLAIISGAVFVSLISVLASDFFISEETSKQLWLLIALCPALLAIAQRGSPASAD